MVGVASDCLYRRTRSLGRLVWSEGRRPLGAVPYSSHEPAELLQWLWAMMTAPKILSLLLLLLLLQWGFGWLSSRVRTWSTMPWRTLWQRFSSTVRDTIRLLLVKVCHHNHLPDVPILVTADGEVISRAAWTDRDRTADESRWWILVSVQCQHLDCCDCRPTMSCLRSFVVVVSPLTPTVAIWVQTAINHPVPDRG